MKAIVSMWHLTIDARSLYARAWSVLTHLSENSIFSLNFFYDIHKPQAYWQLRFFRGLNVLWCKLVVSISDSPISSFPSKCLFLYPYGTEYFMLQMSVQQRCCSHSHHLICVAIYLERSDWKMYVVAKYCPYYPEVGTFTKLVLLVTFNSWHIHHSLSNTT